MGVWNDALLGSRMGRRDVAKDTTALAQGRAGLTEGGGAQGGERILFCETWGLSAWEGQMLAAER